MKAKKASGNGATIKKVLEADYVIGRCRLLGATRLKPASFGIPGWLAWISRNRDTDKDVLHIITSLPNPQKQTGIWHFDLEKISGQKLGFAENGGRCYCYMQPGSQPKRTRLTDRPGSSSSFCVADSLASKALH